jgi:hypothetical protein
MKLLFASLATGILVTAGILIIVLFVRALFKDDASVMFALWFFWWPICFMRLLPGISDKALLWPSLAIGMLLDIVFISFVTYCLLTAIVSRQKRACSASPPQAPTF